MAKSMIQKRLASCFFLAALNDFISLKASILNVGGMVLGFNYEADNLTVNE